MKSTLGIALGLALLCLFTGCAKPPEPPAPPPEAAKPAPPPVPDFGPEKGKEVLAWAPLGSGKMTIPAENPMTPEKWWLGYQLYFDKRLSLDDTVSCATCHDPRKGFSDGLPVSQGVGGKPGKRNAPTTLDSGFHLVQFWDGRAPTLEEQAKGPIANPIEMAMTHDLAVKKINTIPGYREQFNMVFGREEATIDDLAQAIACFERTLISGDSPWDRYNKGDKAALTPEQDRGRDLFFNKAKCSLCHVGSHLSDSDFHNLGVGWAKKEKDHGRYDVTKKNEDKGKFKTPPLRNVKDSAPYMHDGSIATLEEVVVLYNVGGEPNPNLDPKITALDLTEQEVSDLVAFLEGGLQGKMWDVKEPPLPESPAPSTPPATQ